MVKPDLRYEEEYYLGWVPRKGAIERNPWGSQIFSLSD